jgi:thioredoxin
MATVTLTKDNFDEVLHSHEIVIVDFWAPWCGPCKSFAPVYEDISEKFPDITFAKVDTQEQQELAGHFQIRSIPTLMIFREQIAIFAQPGALPGSALEDVIKKASELDMSQVRKEVAEQQATANN